MDVSALKDNEIIVNTQRVKYHAIEYHDNYVTIEQNRTRRRVPNGYYFEDNGAEIYVSTFYSHIFQHQAKLRRFIVNKVTKEWRDFIGVEIERYTPEKMEPIDNNEIKELKDERPATSK